MKNFKIFGIILFLAIAAVLIFLSKCNEQQQKTISDLENKIEFLKQETNPIQFMVTERTDSSISVTYKFLDLDGKAITKVETTMPGQELSFDFYTIQIQDKYLSFPTKIFTDKIAPANAETLFHYYDAENFPQIFESADLSSESRQAFMQLFAQIKSNPDEQIDNSFGNMVHDVEAFKSFQTEVVYSIIAHTKGGIEIIEQN